MIFKPFEKDERICFIGDSITEKTYWIAMIADYYAKSRKDKKISIYPCGIAGGTCLGAVSYMREQTAIYSPTTAVVMLGMNDIGRDNYAESTDKKIALQEKAIKEYEHNLNTLAQQLLTLVGVKRMIFLAPTPYDENMVTDSKNLIGCQAALRRCAVICKSVAKEYGGEFYDFGGELFKLIESSRKSGNKNELIESDRVHPNVFGQSVMARLFLTAQGFDDMTVNEEMILNGSALLELSDKAKAFFTIAKDLQDRWSAEFLICQFSPDKSMDGCIKYMDEYYETIKDTDIDPYFIFLATNYKKWRLNEKEMVNKLKKSVVDFYG